VVLFFFLWFCGPINFFPNIYDPGLCSVGGLLRDLLPAHYKTLGPVTCFVCDFLLTLKKVHVIFFIFSGTQQMKRYIFFET